MKIVIVSDIHANLDALSVLPESYDDLWVLGKSWAGAVNMRDEMPMRAGGPFSCLLRMAREAANRRASRAGMW